MVTIIMLAGKKQGHDYCASEECQVCINEELHWLKTWMGVLVLKQLMTIDCIFQLMTYPLLAADEFCILEVSTCLSNILLQLTDYNNFH